MTDTARPAPSISHFLSNEDYHGGPGISKSQLDRAAKSFAHWQAPSQLSTQAMSFGTAFHASVLEPESFYEQVAVAPRIDRRTKKGKEEWAEFEERSAGKAIISADEYETTEAMKQAVYRHPKAKLVLSSGKPEVSAFWRDELTQLLCKCRPDYVTDSGLIVDLKSTTDASPDGFAKSAAKFRYHVQASWYMEGWRQASGQAPIGFLFVAVEKSPPFNVGLYMLDGEALELGRQTAAKDLMRIKQWQDLADYDFAKASGYSPDIVELKLPSWAFYQGD